MSRAPETTVRLYRVVGAMELADIRQSGTFRPGYGTMETKLFATAFADALHFARLLYISAGVDYTIIEATIPADLAGTLDRFIADRMPTIAVYPEQLAAFNRTMVVRILGAGEE